MNNYSTSLTVYESKLIYLTGEELKKNGYNGRTEIRNACENAISHKTNIYVSRINVFNVIYLDKSGFYEVHYYHIHTFDTVYIESLVYSFYRNVMRNDKVAVSSVYISGVNGITVDVRLKSSSQNPDEITKAVDIKNLREVLKEYITVELTLSCFVQLDSAEGELLRFSC